MTNTVPVAPDETNELSSRRRHFFINMILYIVVMAVVTSFAFVYTAEPNWVLGPWLGWGAGLLLHYWLAFGLGRASKRRRFFINMILYIVVMPVVTSFAFVYTAEPYWVLWPWLGWGAGLLWHYWVTFGFKPRAQQRSA